MELSDHFLTPRAQAGFDEGLVLAAAGAERQPGFGGRGGEFGSFSHGELGDDEELGRKVAVAELF